MDKPKDRDTGQWQMMGRALVQHKKKNGAAIKPGQPAGRHHNIRASANWYCQDVTPNGFGWMLKA